MSTQNASKKALNVNGIPVWLFVVIAVAVIIATKLDMLPDNMGGAFAINLVLGVGLMWIGNHIPVIKDYGLGTILAVLVPSILLYVGFFPQSAADISKNFFSNYDFTSFLVPGLLVGSILAMSRKTLINAGLRFLVPMVLTIIFSTLISGLLGIVTGYGFLETILYIAGPILGAGVSASAVPLSEIYAQNSGGDAGALLTTLTSSVMVANICTILIASILSSLGRKNPDFIMKGFAGRDGKILRSQENVNISEEEKKELTSDPNTTTFSALQTGFLLTCGIYAVSQILAKILPGGLHFYLYMIIIAIILKLTDVLPAKINDASGVWGNFMAKVLTPCTLSAISLGVMELDSVLKLFGDARFLLLCVLCVLVATVVAGLLCYLFGFYFMEGSIMAGLGLADMGGTGDVAVLSAADRMELLPFLTICSRIGGAINMVWLTFLAANFLK